MKCQACGRVNRSVNTEKCTKCGHLYCWSCNGQSGIGGTTCPKCGSEGHVYKDGIASPDGEGDPRPY